MRTQPKRGSHLPVLMKLVQMTSGSILELGCGMYSTTYLHWFCYVTRRRLVTYENDPEYYEFATQFKTDFHEVHCITDWDSIDISEPWEIALIDHSPEERRIIEIKQLLHADYVVAHDADNFRNKKLHYSKILRCFKYRHKYCDTSPHTLILSNKHDLTDFAVR